MTRYYFDTQDGDHDTDKSGVDLPGDAEAVREAVRYAGSLIGDKPGIVIDHPEFIVTVRSETETLARVRIVVERG